MHGEPVDETMIEHDPPPLGDQPVRPASESGMKALGKRMRQAIFAKWLEENM